MNVADDSLGVNEKSRRNRKGIRVVAVASLEVDGEGIKHGLNRLGLLPADAKLTGELVANIRQNLKLELVLLRGAQGGVGQFGRNGNDGDALGMELVEMLLQRAEGEVAEWAPVAAIEGDQDRALGDEALAGDVLAEGVGELEAGEGGAGLDDGALVEGGLEAFDGLADGVGDGSRSVLLDAFGDRGQLGSEGGHCGMFEVGCEG